jgi:hypothetical protein
LDVQANTIQFEGLTYSQRIPRGEFEDSLQQAFQNATTERQRVEGIEKPAGVWWAR